MTRDTSHADEHRRIGKEGLRQVPRALNNMYLLNGVDRVHCNTPQVNWDKKASVTFSLDSGVTCEVGGGGEMLEKVNFLLEEESFWENKFQLKVRSEKGN